VRFINISPVRDDIDTGGPVDWIPIRPGTDTALLLAVAHTLLAEGLHDRAFLASHCVGFERVAAYLRGESDGQAKTADWAAAITGIPATRIVQLAREMAAARTMINIAWSLQRAPRRAALLGADHRGVDARPDRVAGRRLRGRLRHLQHDRQRQRQVLGPTLPQGRNPVEAFIPVARITDMLEQPGAAFDYNGQRHHYPDIRLVYWAGGNPFHHHQDLNRLHAAWQSKPETVVVHEQYWTPTAKLADIVLPATTALEREDIGYATRERYMVAMKKLIDPVGEARDDYRIFSELAERLGASDVFTEGHDAQAWLRLLRAIAPACRRGWRRAAALRCILGQGPDRSGPARSRARPVRTLSRRPRPPPSGHAQRAHRAVQRAHRGFGYDDCPGHACWMEPIEWLGSPKTQRHPLHLISDQPHTKLHSQLDHAAYSQANKINGREPLTLSRTDAQARGLKAGDTVRVFNDRGACLAGLRISDALCPGVARLSTGAWFDPTNWLATGASNVEKHGNPNTLTPDIGASRLSQGCIAQTCLVQVEACPDPLDRRRINSPFWSNAHPAAPERSHERAGSLTGRMDGRLGSAKALDLASFCANTAPFSFDPKETPMKQPDRLRLALPLLFAAPNFCGADAPRHKETGRRRPFAWSFRFHLAARRTFWAA
jgi:biotin/methionine sulfoxide reductase